MPDGDRRPEHPEQPDFTFSLALSHVPHFDSMLANLTGAVLRHVGYPPDAIGELSAQEGELQIELTIVPGSTWRTSKPLP